jgi:hypothetical protein
LNLARRVALALAGAIMILTAAGGPVGAERAGGAVVVDGEEFRPLEGGGSETPFSLTLPKGAACQGDSQSEDYRVQSFVVPERFDPDELVYEGLHPKVEGGYSLYQLDTASFINKATDIAEEPGGEGAIINIPPFTFGVLKPGRLQPGTYHLGIACSLFGETTRTWSTEIEFVSDASDPDGLAWTVIGEPAFDVDGGGRSVPAAALVVGLGAVGIACLLYAVRGRGLRSARQ